MYSFLGEDADMSVKTATASIASCSVAVQNRWIYSISGAVFWIQKNQSHSAMNRLSEYETSSIIESRRRSSVDRVKNHRRLFEMAREKTNLQETDDRRKEKHHFSDP